MAEQTGFKLGWKTFYYWLIFIAMYGIYKALPVFPLSIICGINESNFQHYKATFFALLILALIEYAVHRRKIADLAGFWHPRLLMAVLAPWFVFLIWYFAPAVYGQKMPNIGLEVLYSNVTTVISGFVILVFEQAFTQIRFTKLQRSLLYVLLALSVLYYLVFTFAYLPWADVFIEPQWR
jgi:hypothetical protein